MKFKTWMDMMAWCIMGALMGFGFFWFLNTFKVFPPLINILHAHLLSTAFGLLYVEMRRRKDAII